MIRAGDHKGENGRRQEPRVVVVTFPLPKAGLISLPQLVAGVSHATRGRRRRMDTY